MASLTSVLRQRQFFWFTTGQTVSFFGDKLHAMALIGLIGTLRPDDSPLVLAGLALLYCLPFLVVAPVAGAFVDRWSRKRTLVLCDVLRAGVVVLMPLVYTAAGLVPLLGMVASVVVLTLFFNVAKMAIVPDLVPPHDLLAANAISSVLSRLASLAGIVAGGAIVGASVWERLGWPGYAVGFYLDAFTFTVSVATLSMLTTRPPLAAGTSGTHLGRRLLRHDAREVLELVRGDPRVLFALAASALLGAIAGAMYVTLVVLLQTRTAWGTTGVGLVLGIVAAGIVVGSTLVGRMGGGWPKPRIAVAAFVTIAVAIASFASPFDFALHGPMALIAGTAIGPLMVALDTTLHEALPEHARGRVFSARDIVLNVAFGLTAAVTGLSIFVAGPDGATDPIRRLLLVLAAFVLAMAAGGERFAQRRLGP